MQNKHVLSICRPARRNEWQILSSNQSELESLSNVTVVLLFTSLCTFRCPCVVLNGKMLFARPMVRQ